MTLDSLKRSDLLSVLQEIANLIKIRDENKNMKWVAENNISKAYSKHKKKLSSYKTMKTIGIVWICIVAFPVLIGGVIIAIAAINRPDISPSLSDFAGTSVWEWVKAAGMLICVGATYLSIPIFLIIYGKRGAKKYKPAGEKWLEKYIAQQKPIVEYCTETIDKANKLIDSYYKTYSVSQDLRYYSALVYCYNVLKSNASMTLMQAIQWYLQEEHRKAMLEEQRAQTAEIKQARADNNNNMAVIQKNQRAILDAEQRAAGQRDEIIYSNKYGR